jgi:hypothetical protein
VWAANPPERLGHAQKKNLYGMLNLFVNFDKKASKRIAERLTWHLPWSLCLW